MLSKATEKLLAAALAIEEQSVVDAGELGFMARALTMCTLPHSDPGNDATIYGKRNGPFSLTIQPGVSIGKDGTPVNLGIPYGVLPRLLLCWISTEATQTRSKELVLGHSLSEFMAAIDITPSWGRRGTAGKLRDQMIRLFNCTIRIDYGDRDKEAATRLNVAKSYCLFFHRHPEQGGLWQSTLTLTDEFFEEIIKHPVPLDLRAIRALKKSPLALDLYVWLTYRMSYLKKATLITWMQLHEQFGADYKQVRDFKRAFIAALRKVQAVYPAANAVIGACELTLLPSSTHVPKKGKSLLTT